MAERPDRGREGSGGTARVPGIGHQADAAQPGIADRPVAMVMEEVVSRENMLRAYHRVLQNQGAPGVDGVTVKALGEHVGTRWAVIREQLLSGTYEPQPVRKVEIPKPSGNGKRMLGIPTVMDRMIQQALLEVLQPHFDPTFSDRSFGFRPGRSAHDAVKAAQAHIAAGRRWVVDMDLEKFFDRVNHDVLMARLARRIEDKRILRVIRRYLQAGMMEGGLVSPRTRLRPVCRRLQHLRAVAAGWPARAGLHRAFSEQAPPAEGEPGEECGRPTVEAEVPGIQRNPPPHPQTEGLPGVAETADGEPASAVPTGARPEPQTYDRGHHPAVAGMGKLLPLGGGPVRVRGTGSVAPAPPAMHPLAAVEEATHSVTPYDRVRTGSGSSPARSLQWQRPLGERRGLPYAPRRADPVPDSA